MGWLSVAALVVASCDKGPPPSGLFTADEVAGLEARALALGAPAPTNFKDLYAIDEEIRSIKSGDPTNAVIELARHASVDPAIEAVLKPHDANLITARVDGEVSAALQLWPTANPSKQQLEDMANYLDAAIAGQQPFAHAITSQTDHMRQLVVFGEPGVPKAASDDECGLELTAANQLDAIATKFCTDTLNLCAAHLASAVMPNTEAKALLVEHTAEIHALKNADERRALQNALATRVAGGWIKIYQFELAHRVTVLARIVALRIAVEVRRTGACDVHGAFTAPPILGGELTVTTKDHAVEILPPRWANVSYRAPITVACP